MNFLDERTMDETIKRLRTGANNWRLTRRLKRIGDGMRRLMLFLWWLVGRVDSYFICSGFLVLVGFTQLAITQTTAPAGALVVIERTANVPGWFVALSFVVLGWLISYSKSPVLLTLGALMLFGYAGALIYGTATATVDARGWLGALYVIFGALGFWRASYAEMQLDTVTQTVAALKAAKDINGQSIAVDRPKNAA